MARFIPSMENLEKWAPADRRNPFPSPYMEEVSPQFAALSLMQQGPENPFLPPLLPSLRNPDEFQKPYALNDTLNQCQLPTTRHGIIIPFRKFPKPAPPVQPPRQRQQNHTPRSYSGSGGRVYGGTGVFLPRVGLTTAASQKQGSRNRHEYRPAKQGGNSSRRPVAMEEEGQSEPPIESVLPQEWTY